MTKYGTYNKVHVATKGASDEADFHADMDDNQEDGRRVQNRVEEIDSIAGIALMLQKLNRESFDIDYLDFHAHGHGAAFYVNDSATFDTEDIAQFRSYSKMFREGAVISFLSCDVASVNLDKGEDGELFMAEMARVFLYENGGSVLGRNKDWLYKPPLGLGLFPAIGPFKAKFKNDGAQIVAEMSAHGIEPTLRGQFHLDRNRLAKEIFAVRTVITSAMNTITTPNRSYAPPPQTGAPLDDLVARYLNNKQTQDVLKAITTRDKNIGILNRCSARLDHAAQKLKGWGGLYQRLHDAAVLINDEVDVIASIGVPVATVLPAALTALRAVPVDL